MARKPTNLDVARAAAGAEWDKLTGPQQATIRRSSGLTTHGVERSWSALVRRGLATLRISKRRILVGFGAFPNHAYNLTPWGSFVASVGRELASAAEAESDLPGPRTGN